MRAGYSLSLLYRDQARVLRAAGAADKAAAVETKRLALWKQWSEKLPNNAFVLKQLTAGDEDAAALTRRLVTRVPVVR